MFIPAAHNFDTVWTRSPESG